MKFKKAKTSRQPPKTMTEDTTAKRLAEIGRASMDSIIEMVDALNREKAATRFSETLDRQTCVKILTDECGIECYDTESLETLQVAVASNIEDRTCEPEGFEFDEDAARQTIQEDPLEVAVRSGWYSPGGEPGDPEEFKILLGTGGPAVRIIGSLDRGEPDSAKLQTQDWFTPWTDFNSNSDEDEVLLTYCREFYFQQ